MDRVNLHSVRITGIVLILVLLMGSLMPAVSVYSSGNVELPVVKNVAVASEVPIVFPDAGLEAAVRSSLPVPKPTGTIYQSDLNTLTSLDADECDISNLSGMEHCTSLIDIQLRKNNISDVSQLYSLPVLMFLDLGENQISEISPLASLTGLVSLSLDHNNISDISALSSLSGLSVLYLGKNLISDISALEALTSLSALLLEYNQITDISPLVANSGLESGDYVSLVYNYLDLTDGAVEDIATLSGRGVVVDSLPQKEVSLNISFLLQGYGRPESGWLVPVTVKFFSTSNVLKYTFELTASNEGGSAVVLVDDIPSGTYNITLVSPHCLTNIKRNVAVAGFYNDVDLGTLLEGDSDNNGHINILDFGILKAAYGKIQGDVGYDERADFDRNGRINIADFGLLALNYNKSAPVEIQEIE
jgi:hypothetical protein